VEEIVIRDFEPGDIDAVVETTVLAWEPIFEASRERLGDEMFGAERPDWRRSKGGEVRATLVRDDPVGCIVAEDAGSGRVVAFATFSANATGMGALRNNAVHPEFQGKGLGSRMYDRVFEKLRELECRFVRVHTGLDDAHAPGRRAYERRGFKMLSKGCEYYMEL